MFYSRHRHTVCCPLRDPVVVLVRGTGGQGDRGTGGQGVSGPMQCQRVKPGLVKTSEGDQANGHPHGGGEERLLQTETLTSGPDTVCFWRKVRPVERK